MHDDLAESGCNGRDRARGRRGEGRTAGGVQVPDGRLRERWYRVGLDLVSSRLAAKTVAFASLTQGEACFERIQWWVTRCGEVLVQAGADTGRRSAAESRVRVRA
jgi:hypothetical protein